MATMAMAMKVANFMSIERAEEDFGKEEGVEGDVRMSLRRGC
jgi:hypothetical protein